MNDQTAYQPLALRDSDPRDCVYNEVSDQVFCFLSDVEAHLIAANGLSAYAALKALAAGATQEPADPAPKGKKSSGTGGDAAGLLDPMQGKYRLNSSWNCQVVGSDGGAIEIRANLLHSVETRCELSDGQPVGVHGAAVFQGMCSGEGETWQDEFILRRTDWGGLGVMSSNGASTWEACP